jgi:hypothetical protein
MPHPIMPATVTIATAVRRSGLREQARFGLTLAKLGRIRTQNWAGQWAE